MISHYLALISDGKIVATFGRQERCKAMDWADSHIQQGKTAYVAEIKQIYPRKS